MGCLKTLTFRNVTVQNDCAFIRLVMFVCRRCVGPPAGRFNLSHWMEQRFLHAHLCRRLSLRGQNRTLCNSETLPLRIQHIQASLLFHTVIVTFMRLSRYFCTNLLINIHSPLFVCFVQFLARLVFKEIQVWCGNTVPRARGWVSTYSNLGFSLE